MFRSIANLVAHKRAFCKQVYTQVRHTFSDQEDKENTVEVVVEPEDAGCSTDLHTWNMDNFSPSMDLIRYNRVLQNGLITSDRFDYKSSNYFETSCLRSLFSMRKVIFRDCFKENLSCSDGSEGTKS